MNELHGGHAPAVGPAERDGPALFGLPARWHRGRTHPGLRLRAEPPGERHGSGRAPVRPGRAGRPFYQDVAAAPSALRADALPPDLLVGDRVSRPTFLA